MSVRRTRFAIAALMLVQAAVVANAIDPWVVKEGDTLFAIARKEQVPLDVLRQFNGHIPQSPFGGARILRYAELLPNLSHNFLRSRCNVDDHSVFRFFQIGKLASENLFAGEMSLARAQPLPDQLGAALQIYEADFRSRLEFPPVDAFQSRAGQHYVLLVRGPAVDCSA